MDINTVLIAILLFVSLYLAYQGLAMPLSPDASIKVSETGKGNPKLRGFVVSFSTTADKGLLFVNSPEANKYVGVYLKAGKVVVEAQVAANDPVKVAFDASVNDGKDHVVKVLWESGKVTASLDSGASKEVALANSSQAFIYGKMQIGSGAGITGLSADAAAQFKGCINYIKLPSGPLTSSDFKLGAGLTAKC